MKGLFGLHIGDALTELRKMPDKSVNCCVTSPPYWGLRDYKVDGQLGLEETPEEYVDRLVGGVFHEVFRVLCDDGTLWVNIGDSYNAAGRTGHGTRIGYKQGTNRASATGADACRPSAAGLKEKDLVGIPWMVAFALRADGWYLRSDIIWSKKNCMPESVKDRPTKSHEYIFLLSKSASYYYDHEAIREPYAEVSIARAGRNSYPNEERALAFPGQPSFRDRGEGTIKLYAASHKGSSFNKGKTASHQLERASEGEREDNPAGRNKRSVWDISTKPFFGAHFAVFPPDLIEPCILAGCPEGGVVLDPFTGSGTTGEVALKNFRRFVGIELNPIYANEIAIPRLEREAGRPKQMQII